MKLGHWKKLDHVLFVLMGFPLCGMAVSQLMHEEFFASVCYIIIVFLWLLIIIIDQLEEKGDKKALSPEAEEKEDGH